MPPVTFERKNEATNPGELVPVNAIGGAPSQLVEETEPDTAAVVHIQNCSDTAVTLHLADEPFTEGEGIVLRAATITDGVITEPGGSWYEERWAGVVYAKHHGASGTKNVSVTIW